MTSIFKSVLLSTPMAMRNLSTSTAQHAKQLGLVKWFDATKGFGFISPDADSKIDGDVFVHQSNIISATGFRTLQDGLRVAFECRLDNKGKNQAYEVTLEDGSPVKFESSESNRR